MAKRTTPIPESVGEPGTVRREIEERAMELFARRGYEATSVREIVVAAGVSAPTLYYHFGSKQGLFHHLIDGLRDELLRRLEAAAARSGIRAQLLQFVREEIATLIERPAVVRFLHRVIHAPGEHEGIRRELIQGDFDGGRFEALFRAAVARGELVAQPIELLLNAFIGPLNLYVMRRALPLCHGADALELGVGDGGLLPGLGEASLDDAEEIVDLFLLGAAAPGPAD